MTDYNSTDLSISKTMSNGFSIDDDICKNYDKLDHDYFEECIRYLNQQYRTLHITRMQQQVFLGVLVDVLEVTHT